MYAVLLYHGAVRLTKRPSSMVESSDLL